MKTVETGYTSGKPSQSGKKSWWGKSWKYPVGILVLAIVLNVAVGLVVRTYIFRAYKMPSASMQPTLLIGDCIIVDKLPTTVQSIERKDIVVFPLPEDPSKKFVKRVIGLPGDLIEIRDKRLYLNGRLFKEAYVAHNDESIKPYRDNYGPAIVPEGFLFVLGDNRDFSYDSRMFGNIDQRTVEGRVKWIYWSWDKERFRVRFERVGATVN